MTKKETELELLTQEIQRLSVRRESIESNVKLAKQCRESIKGYCQANRQQPHQQRPRRANKSAGSVQHQSREAVIREQHTQKAISKFVKIKDAILRKYGWHSKSRGFERQLLDSRSQELKAGDFVQAIATGKNYAHKTIFLTC